jgi:polyferredoxin
MTRLGRTLLAVAVLAVASGVAQAEHYNVRPPQFQKHQIPELSPPEARSNALEYLDLAALVVALSLASFFALKLRSRKALFVLTLASLAWFGFWRAGCVCAIGATQNVTLALCDSSYGIPVFVVGFFVLPLVFTLFFGRTFCAAVCPLGAAQELVAVRPVKVPAWLEHALGLLPFLYLGLAVMLAATGTAFIICRYDPFVNFFRLGGGIHMLIFGGSVLLIGAFVGRPYCRYLCPYGAILGCLSRASRQHVRIPPEECIQCRLCEDACPYGAIQEPTVALSPAERRRGRRRLAAVLLLFPVLIAACAWAGTFLGGPLSRMDPTVRLAERVILEKTEGLEERTDASRAFYEALDPITEQELARQAIDSRRRFRTAAGWLGAWVGLVIAVKLIHLSIRRRRVGFQPDRTNCVSCGRCFWYCPAEQARLGLIRDLGPWEPDRELRPTEPEPETTGALT